MLTRVIVGAVSLLIWKWLYQDLVVNAALAVVNAQHLCLRQEINKPNEEGDSFG